MKKAYLILAAAACFGLSSQVAMADGINAEKLYNSKCKMCHKVDGKKMGPGFKQMNSDAAVLKDVITNGRKSMPKFSSKFNEEQIDAMVAFIISNQH